MKPTPPFIVIEGTDGSGKGTHTHLLASWIKEQGHDLEVFDFPQYGTPSAYFVEQYLNGRYGELEDIGPYRGSLFYALDRYDAGFKIKAAQNRGAIVISNRYVGSNMGHQGGKIANPAERAQYFEWNDHLEFDILGIPRPDLNIVLLMPSEQAQAFVDKKAAREYTGGKKRDIHEANIDHLRNAETAYRELCQTFPKSFTPIECFDGQSVLSIDTIQAKIRKLVSAKLHTTKE